MPVRYCAVGLLLFHSGHWGSALRPDDFPVYAGAMKFDSVDKHDLVSRVTDALAKALVDGQMAPGMRLNEVSLSREFEISRAPLREALRRLESRGLVVSQPRRGFFVPSIDATQTNDLFEVRIAIEALAGQKLCQSATPQQLADIRKQYEQMCVAAESGRSERMIEEDFGFHRLICQASGNQKLLQIFDQISGEIRFAIAHVRGFHTDMVALAKSHEPIVVALETSDLAAFERTLEKHLGEAREKLVSAYGEAKGDPA